MITISSSLDLDIDNAICAVYDTSSNSGAIGERQFTVDSMTSRVCIMNENVDNKDADICNDNYCLLTTDTSRSCHFINNANSNYDNYDIIGWTESPNLCVTVYPAVLDSSNCLT